MIGLKMKIINKESTVFFDVDDTLVMWKEQKGPTAKITIVEPHYGDEVLLTPHSGHIKILKDRKARGSFIVVWSAGGYAWAEAVVKALNLEEYVYLVMKK